MGDRPWPTVSSSFARLVGRRRWAAGRSVHSLAKAEGDAVAESKRSGARRTGQVVGAVLVVVVLPALVMWALVGEFGVSAMFVGLVLGVVGCQARRHPPDAVRRARAGGRGGAGRVTAYDWWWAALLAVAGVIAGAGIGFGWLAPLLMIPYAATFVTPVTTGTDAVIYGVIVGIATLYGIVVARRFGAPDVVEGPPSPCRSPLSSRSCSVRSWVPARRSASRWDGRSPTGFPSRCSSWCSTS